MTTRKEFPNNLSDTFPKQGTLTKKTDRKKEDYCYGIETGNRFVKRFKLMLGNGCIVSIPYAYLPIISLTVEKQLTICTHDLTINIKGRNLTLINDWLNEEKILWIKESSARLDTGALDVFVSEIKIDSEWLH